MRRLNRDAATQLRHVTGPDGPRACTDVTGYGLLGHGWEVAEHSGAAVRFDSNALPIHEGAEAAAVAGTRTGGHGRNEAALVGHLDLGDAVRGDQVAIALDPQTSGGLLAAVTQDQASELAALGWWIVGEVLDGDPVVQLV